MITVRRAAALATIAFVAACGSTPDDPGTGNADAGLSGAAGSGAAAGNGGAGGGTGGAAGVGGGQSGGAGGTGFVCKSDADCPMVGAPCQVCADGSYSCPISACSGGQCTVEWNSCSAVDGGSAGAGGGTGACSADSDCPGTKQACIACPVAGSESCPYPLCAGGQCATAWTLCPGYDPCGGKACGDACTVCDPKDPTCIETGIVKTCGADGACSPGTAACGGGGGACKADSDCSLADDYCTGCDCRALSAGQSLPACPGPGVECVAEPCANHLAVCLNGQCAVK